MGIGYQNNCTVNNKYFQKPTKDASYILGYLWADGTIVRSKKPNGTYKISGIGFECEKTDGYLIETIRNKMKSTHAISRRTRIQKSGKKTSMVGLNISRLNMVNDVKIYGVVAGKSFLDPKPKNIPVKWERHFIRGVFDGDGTINKVKNKWNQWRFAFCGRPSLIRWICKKLWAYGLSKNAICFDKRTKKPFCMVEWSSKKDIKLFSRYIYKNVKDLFLKRKYENFTHAME